MSNVDFFLDRSYQRKCEADHEETEEILANQNGS